MNNGTKIISVRGAVTTQNSIDAIREASIRLLNRIYFKNGLTDEDVINIFITVTSDLTAFSPARVLRESGHEVALLCGIEPDINGEIPGCIRMMVSAYSDNTARHIYLNGARKLRPDIARNYAIALDGPSGAGKSTVAKLVAKKLDITYLDTGALYRALGLKCLDSGVPANDAEAVEKALGGVTVDIKYADGIQNVMLDGKDVADRIRTPEVSMAASAVSAIPYVRKKLLGLQRNIAAESSVILDGRDIGTVVLPDAEFKFFLTASAEVRAMRRYKELKDKGKDVTYDGVYSDVVTRDKNDSSRAIAPLKCAFDGVTVNSDDMTAEQVAEYIVSYVSRDIE